MRTYILAQSNEGYTLTIERQARFPQTGTNVVKFSGRDLSEIARRAYDSKEGTYDPKKGDKLKTELPESKLKEFLGATEKLSRGLIPRLALLTNLNPNLIEKTEHAQLRID